MAHKPLHPTAATRSRIQIVHPDVTTYLTALGPAPGAALEEMEQLATELDFPIVGRLVGSMLEVLALTVQARRIFEFGSGFGYSAYWFGRAAGSEGRVVCTDGNAENRARAERFLTAAGLWPRIDFRTGWAQELFAATTGEFDIVYNDVDKGGYPEVWRLARKRIRLGGLYIADNVLWSGRVTEQLITDDVVPGWTEAIREHNRLIFSDPEFDSFINPIRDGVLVARGRS